MTQIDDKGAFSGVPEPEQAITTILGANVPYWTAASTADFLEVLAQTGFVVVPKEPTEAMMLAGAIAWPDMYDAGATYQAMIAAAPLPQTARAQLCQCGELREALRFYANRSAYRTCTVYMGGTRPETQIEMDGGDKARAALALTVHPDLSREDIDYIIKAGNP